MARHRSFLAITLLLSTFVAQPSLTARGDAHRFVRGTRGVFDVRSRLTWSYGEPRFLAWESAHDHCRSLAGGFAWRLPSVDELSSVVVPARERRDSFALPREVFGRATGAAYWSADARTRRDDGHRLAVDEDGSIESVSTRSPLAVRCVRDDRR